MYGTDITASLEKTLIIVAIAAGFVLVVFLFLKVVEAVSDQKQSQIPVLCLIAFVFGTLALVTGMITGASRNAAVGDVIPAALGLIGAVALYVVTKSPREVPLAATAVASFSILLLFGTVLGSYERVRSVAYQESLRYDFPRLKSQADIEFVINGYRRSRGLEPLDFSD
ncbi:hypothetical protein [uncultured Tateyamaria sp.]|uniref:hypothetical protein n=1 Tax=uncultured Tateyamaria sp. TaxID=455651 RepID=UPI002613C396|nr:hypothetical protein [uncultured Tateyamaria sp.]